ncbi:unnamed protein product [Kluyveromyces dobzhanskii CBS 2104]|uniref:WGS project CCBQ000000000 data, contig 00015 n=1 Tax=Kluyveromyces dobzhanskii CBS 2104 TaxID=1427455 RepID=A0A0A8L9N7_9SACH|nr:unnamed protein product [Kluyveromyces dobzhanskii CBS 2104]
MWLVLNTTNRARIGRYACETTMARHNCEDESHAHSHAHGHGHSHEPPVETFSQQSLFAYIDTTKVRVLNAVSTDRSSSVSKYFLKPQDQKYDTSLYLESDADCQVLFQVPFTASVKIFSVLLRVNRNGSGYSSPKQLLLYKNYNKNLDFDTISDLKADYNIEYPNNVGVEPGYDNESLVDDDTFVKFDLPRNVFQNCESLTVLVKNNWSDDEDDLNRIYFCELRGEVTGKLRNTGVPIIAVYEAAPNPAHAKLESQTANYAT